MNQDGVNDIVVACQGLGATGDPTADPSTSRLPGNLFGAMVILQNSASPGTFAAPVIYTGVQGSISLAIGDLNKDGLPDIAMTSLYPQGQGYIADVLRTRPLPGPSNSQQLHGLGSAGVHCHR